MPNSSGSRLQRYAFALGCMAAATVLQMALAPILGDRFPFATLLFAVLASTWYGGFGPAMLATILGAISSSLFLLRPENWAHTYGFSENLAGLLLYLSVGSGISLLGGRMRAAQKQSSQYAREADQQRERWQATLRSVGDGVIVTDVQGRVTSLNPIAEYLTGWAQADAVNRPLDDVFEITNEQTGIRFRNPVQRVIESGSIVGLANHTILKSRDGFTRLIDDSASPVHDHRGKLIGVVLVFRDVSERRQAERSLRESAAVKTAIHEAALDCIISIDEQSRLVEFNAAAEQTFGYRREEVLGKPMPELLIPADFQSAHRAGVARYLETGEGPLLNRRVEVVAKRADGTTFPAEIAITPTNFNGGKLFTAYLRDITDRQKAERRRGVRQAITQILSDTDSVPEASLAILREICNGLDWDLGRLWTIDPREKTLRCAAAWAKDEIQAEDLLTLSHRQSFQKGEGLTGSVWETGKSQWIANIEDDACFPSASSALKCGFHGVLAIPVAANMETIGAIEFFSRDVGMPDPDLTEMLSTVGGQIGQYLERRRAEQNLHEEIRVRDALNRIGATLAAQRDLETIVQLVTDEATQLTDAQFGAFFYNEKNEEGEAYLLYTLSGAARSAFEGFPMPRNTEIFEPTFRGEGVVRFADVTAEPAFGKNAPYSGMPPGHLPVRSYLAVPVVSRSNEVIGGLFFGHEQVGVFTDRHEQIAANIASQAAVAIDNARLYGRLRESEQRFGQLAEHIADMFWILDPAEPRFLYLSPAFDEVFGIAVSDAMKDHQTFLNCIHPEEREGFLDAIERQRRGEATAIEYRIRRPDGSERWIWDRGFPIEADAGTGLRIAGVAEDITERKAYEDELEDREERLRLSLEAGRMGVWDWDMEADGAMTGGLHWSETLEAIHGLKPGAFGGSFEDFQKLVHPDDRDAVARSISRALNDGDSYDIEFRNLWADSSVHWMAGKGKAFRGPGGVTRMIGVGMDITVRKQAEQDAKFLANASAALSDLVDFHSTLQKIARLAVPAFADLCAIDLSKPDGTLERMALVITDPEKLESVRELAAVHARDPAMAARLQAVLESGQSELIADLSDYDLPALEEERFQQIRIALGMKSLIRVPLMVRGKSLGIITFISAESGRRYDEIALGVSESLAQRASIAIENTQLNEALRDADRRKDEFLAMLAHELRNPLAPIRNALEILKIAREDAAVSDEAREMAERQVHHLSRLVDDLLDVSRIMRGKIELRREVCDVGQLVTRTVDTLRPAIDAAELAVQVTAPEDEIFVHGDVVRLSQVASNLISNAVKYSSTGGLISVSVSRQGPDAIISVRDTGIGIAPELVPRVFEMFMQLAPRDTRSHGGLGIGLTLVRTLVELHGGRVTGRSDGAGLGSEFIVRLPVVNRDANNAAAFDSQQASTDPPPFSARRILIVDDNIDASVTLAVLLRKEGHDVRVEHSGTAALAAVEANPPEFVLLDIGMPGMDGYETARRLRHTHPPGRMFLCALTGWGQEQDRRRSREAGFDEHFVKPVDPDAIKELLLRPLS